MQPEAYQHLHDVRQAANRITDFIGPATFETYKSDVMLRSAVERQFEIIGEALLRLARQDSESITRISEYQRIIGFRNILIHDYTDVDDTIVWDTIQLSLPVLRRDVDELLAE